MCTHVHDYVHTKFHIPCINGSLHTATKPKAIENFGHLFYTLQKITFT
jgi:hypothetical protein